MATYYVRKTGSDAAAGTSAGAAWLTIGKALGAAGIASGDTVYVGAGTYREAVTVAMTSATAETSVIADTEGTHTGDAGQVIWTTFLTDNKTPGAGGIPLVLAARDFLTFDRFYFVPGGANNSVNQTSGDATNITFRRCVFLPSVASVTVNIINASVLNYSLLFEQCIFVGSANNILQIRGPLNPTGNADYDIGVTIRNCIFAAGGGTSAYNCQSSGGSGTGKPGGTKFYNNTIYGGTTGISLGVNHSSTTFPALVYNNIFAWLSGTALNAATSGQITEDYNVLVATTPRANVTAGGNSASGTNPWAMLLHFGVSPMFGFLQRPFMEPLATSPLLGVGSDASVSLATDIFGNPRPAGGASALKAVGAHERGNTWGKETTTVRTGSNAISITGPGYQDFLIPVDASATTVTCYLRQDTTYAGTSPTLIALANAAIGVTEQTDTLVVADDTWEQLSVSFTPTAKGIITIRLLSSDTNGGGKAFADDFAVA